MSLDSSIITSIKPVQIDSPVNALAQVLKVQSMQQEGQLGQAKLDEYQRAKGRQNQLLDLVKALPANTTDDQRIDAMKGAGYFDEADKLQTGMVNRRKVEADAKSKEWEAQSKKLDLAGQAFNMVRQNPTLESANQVLDYLGQNGIYSPETVAQYKATVASDPSKIASLAETAFRTVLGAKEQLMKVDTRNLGGSTQTMGVDPVTGKATVLSSVANTQSPDNAATVAATKRGQDITAGTAANRLSFDKTQAETTQDAAMDPLAVRMTAQQYLAGDTSALQNFGRGAQGAANLNAVRLEISKQATAAGMSGADIAAKVAEFGGLKAGQRTAGTRSASIEIAANEVAQLAPIALEASAKVARSGLMPLGKLQVSFDANTNDPNLRQFAMANTALVNAYGQAMARNGTATVADKDHAREMLSTAFDQPSYAAAVAQLQKETRAAQAAPKQVRKDLSDSISGREAPAPGAAGMPDDIAALIKKHGGK